MNINILLLTVPKLLNITVNYVFMNETIVTYIDFLVVKDINLNNLIHV
jgi:hypothetical protein